MNQQVTIMEDNYKATYTWMDKGDSQGYHIYYSGPRGNFTTTYLGFYGVIKNALRKGFEIIGSSFDNLEEVISKAKEEIKHEDEINERWQKKFGSSCILI